MKCNISHGGVSVLVGGYKEHTLWDDTDAFEDDRLLTWKVCSLY